MTGKSQSKVNGAEHFFESMKSFAQPKIDMEQVLGMYRKNMETLAAAQKSSMEMLQDMAKKQADFSRRMMEETRDHYQNLVAAKSLEERAQMQTNKVKETMEAMMHHSKNVADTWSKSSSAIGEKLQDRFKEHVKEAQKMAENAMSGK